MSYELVREVLDYAPPDLSTPERLVLLVLAEHANARTRQAHPGRDLLAAECGLSEDGVRKIIRRLDSRGLITNLGGGHNGRAVTYALGALNDGRVSASQRVYDARAARRQPQHRADLEGQTSDPSTPAGRADSSPARGDARLPKGGLSSAPSVKNPQEPGGTHGNASPNDPHPDFGPCLAPRLCGGCGKQKTRDRDLAAEQQQQRAARRAATVATQQAAMAACADCDEAGWLVGHDGAVIEPARRCTHTVPVPA